MKSKEMIEHPTYLCRVDVNNKYYTWLCNLVGMGHDGRDYELLLKTLHNKDFLWSVPNDDNRAFEGKELRCRFCEECNIVYGYDQYSEAASMLELFIALAYRCESIMIDLDKNTPMYDWFWRLISNVGLSKCSDDCGNGYIVNEILDKIINRTYNRNGYGGLFPLKRPKKDQRKVELWYQMSSYLIENYYTEDMFV